MKNQPSVVELNYISKIDKEKHICRGLHTHSSTTEITLITGGENSYFIGEELIHVMKGDLVIVNADTLHSEGEILPSFCVGLHANKVIGDTSHPLFHFKTKLFDELLQATEIAFASLSTDNIHLDNFANNLIVRAVMPLLLTEINNYPQLKQTSTLMGARIKKYIDEHYCDELSVKQICNFFNVSNTYLDKEFKFNFGYTPLQYITSRRIGKAQTLLITDPTLSLTQIALLVGLPNVNYFQRIFKSFTKIPPKAFQNQFLRRTRN